MKPTPPPPPADHPEADNAAGAGCMARLVLPSDISNGLLHAADDHPCCKATLHAAANLLANIPDPHGPLSQSYSRAELADKLEDWMIKLWGGSPKNLDPENRDQWYRDNGLIYLFICDHFPVENAKRIHPHPQEPQ